MKKILCIIISLCLVLGSFSFAFGLDWSSSDSTNLQYIAQRLTAGSYSAASWLQQIYGTLNGSQGNAVSYLSDIASKLSYQQSIYNTLSTMATNLAHIRNAITANSGNAIGNILENIYNALIRTDAAGSAVSYLSDLRSFVLTTRNNVTTITTAISSIQTALNSIDGSTNSIDTTLSGWNTNFTSTLSQWVNNNRNLRSVSFDSNLIPTFGYSQGNIWGHIVGGFSNLIVNTSNQIKYSHALLGVMRSGSFFSGYNLNEISYDFSSTDDLLYKGLRNISNSLARITSFYGASQSITNWTGSTLTTSSYVPSSVTDGLYKYLNSIQTPIARLAYVHASDDEISAREKAAANQNAVVNNFIDSNGNGSIGTQDISGMATMSSGFKSFFSTGVGSGNIFSQLTNQNDSNDWYSEDTYNKLMGISNTRSAKSSGSDYPTPLLDERMSELTSLFGGEN